MVLPLMTLLVRLGVSSGPSARLSDGPVRRTRPNQSGFDAESHGLRRGARTIKSSRSDSHRQRAIRARQYRETVPREITRRDDQRTTEQGDERPQERVLGETGRCLRPRRSFERRRAVCRGLWRPGRRLAGEPGRTGQLGAASNPSSVRSSVRPRCLLEPVARELVVVRPIGFEPLQWVRALAAEEPLPATKQLITAAISGPGILLAQMAAIRALTTAGPRPVRNPAGRDGRSLTGHHGRANRCGPRAPRMLNCWRCCS